MHSSKVTLGASTSLPILHPRTVREGFRYARKHGVRAALSRVVQRLSRNLPYESWVARYDTLRNRDRRAIREHLASLRYTPEIAVLLRLDEAGPFLRESIESVIAQLYPHWRLCITTGAGVDAETRAWLDELARADARILVCDSAPRFLKNGAATIELASADFLAVLGADDVLPPHALYMMAVALNEHPDADILYSDEDKIEVDGKRRDPFFKPDWSPALFHSQNIASHLAVFRVALVRELGGFREEFGVAQDYDLALRMSARTTEDRIQHLPYILYHARLAQRQARPSAAEAARRALGDHLVVVDDAADIVPGGAAGTWRVKRPLPHPAPLVSLIVPTRDRVELLRSCVDGLLYRTRYPNLEIIIVDNESCEPATFAYFDELRSESRVRVLRVEGAFNFSALNNRAAGIANGELLGFINNDIEVIEPDWLEEMVSQALQPRVGAVGAKLYYSDDTIQHAGVVLGLGGVAGHSHRYFPRDAAGYCGRLHQVHDVSCVTAACMLVWKRVFDEVGGLDEVNLQVALNDVDFCIKIREAGHRLIWTPYAELYHHESASRGSDLVSANLPRFSREMAYMKKRWAGVLQHDPFYSPNLSLDDEYFALAFPPRIGKPWDAYKGHAKGSNPP
jgi:GT2 family glycosyltransferase